MKIFHKLKPVRLLLNLAATGVVLGSASIANSASQVGVAAAVNTHAKSVLPSGKVRSILLGNKVVFNERIDTSGSGLVQVLFTDGSSLTVGPNSSLVIDKYVYNPSKNNGKLVVSFGRGVMRFVGGKLSKNKGGVTIRTTVGTAGIRGGMANIAVVGNKGVFSFLFGHELSFVGLDGQRRRVYQSGYTLLAEKGNGATNSKVLIRRTTVAETEYFQRKLAGRAGQRGGARIGPSDRQVAEGGFPQRRTGLRRVHPKTNPSTVLSSPLPDLEDGLLDFSRDRRCVYTTTGGPYPATTGSCF